MENKVPVVITRSRRPEKILRNFIFKYDDIRPGNFFDCRKHAYECYSGFPLPSTDDEAWRRTDLRHFPADTFHLPDHGLFNNFVDIPSRLLRPLISKSNGGQLILKQGNSSILLDPEIVNQGVIYSDLCFAEQNYPDLLRQYLGQIIHPEDGKFAALTAAFSQNGGFLYIPKGVNIEKPFHSIIWGSGSNLAHIDHFLIWIDDDSSATVVHELTSPEGKDVTMHAGNIEIIVGRNASLKFIELQSLGSQSWNFTNARAKIGSEGKLDWIIGATGSRLTKMFSEIDLIGESAWGRMSGFYFANGNQHLDLDTQQNHLAPKTTSDLFFKGALKGSSRVVWQGMIYVSPEAPKTDGFQSNRNLLLDKNTRADSIPGLEILADDVRCTHGVTIGRLEEEQIFYSITRGIPRMDAERMLVEGFFDPIMQRIPFKGVRDRLLRIIKKKMGE